MIIDRDWRLPEYRLESFCRITYSRNEMKDLDHTYWLQTLSEGLDIESRLWMAYLFGRTYCAYQTHVYHTFFPDVHKIDEETIINWNADHWNRTKYSTDTKYNKGHFAKMVLDYIKWLDGRTQLQALIDAGIFLDTEKRHDNFRSLNKIPTDQWFKFGQMTSWLYSQAVHDIVPEIPNTPDSLVLDDKINSSVWNGICFLHNREDLMIVKDVKRKPPTKSEKSWLNDKMHETLNYFTSNYPGERTHLIDFYNLETALCQYKKFFTGHEYIGHSNADYVNRSEIFMTRFSEVDWSLCKKAANGVHEIIRHKKLIRADDRFFKETGKIIYGHVYFDDMPKIFSTQVEESLLYTSSVFR